MSVKRERENLYGDVICNVQILINLRFDIDFYIHDRMQIKL